MDPYGRGLVRWENMGKPSANISWILSFCHVAAPKVCPEIQLPRTSPDPPVLLVVLVLLLRKLLALPLQLHNLGLPPRAATRLPGTSTTLGLQGSGENR